MTSPRLDRSLDARVLFTLGAASAIALALVVALRLETPSRRLPVAAPACCSISSAQAQTPSPASNAITIRVGERLDFALDPSKGISGGGTWQADYGTVTSDGHYTAPVWLPPQALDNVLYVAPDGRTLDLTVHLIARPGETPPPAPVVRYAFASTTEANAQGSGPTPAASSAGAAREAPSSGPTPDPLGDALQGFRGKAVVLADGEAMAAAVPVQNGAEIAKVVVQGNREYLRLPATEAGAASTALLAYSPAGRPVNRCKVGPRNDDQTGKPCRYGGPHTGRTNVRSDDLGTDPMGAIKRTVDAKLKADLKTFGAEFAIGFQIDVMALAHKWKVSRDSYTDSYRCVNGSLVFDNTAVCHQDGIKRKYVQRWYEYFLGKLPEPSFQPQPPACRRL